MWLLCVKEMHTKLAKLTVDNDKYILLLPVNFAVVIVSVASVCVFCPVHALTFASLDLETSFFCTQVHFQNT